MGDRRLTGLQQRAVDRAIDGCRHRVEIDDRGCVLILPLNVDPAQAEDAVLDAEIRGHINGHGHAGH